jgi:hypothetical protein
MAITRMLTMRRISVSGRWGWRRAPGVGACQAAEAEPDPVGQSGATGPSSWMAKMVKVTTPAAEVTNVDARAAGAACDGGRPVPIKMGARIEPPPMP